jgi:GMP synthase (glutamine-hydrolysing)
MKTDNKPILIVKLGATFPELSLKIGDFEDWIKMAIASLSCSVTILDAKACPVLPEPRLFAGIILTGSSAMVTDKEAWSERLKSWLILCANKSIPVLGICYGHQLLADTFGGKVETRKEGVEIGTVTITRSLKSQSDDLFKDLPIAFSAHTVHWQSVTQLPAHAVLLGSSKLDRHHAYRIGNTIWGVQFHPEFSETAMSFYIQHYQDQLIQEGKDPEILHNMITPTNAAHLVLKRFVGLCFN